MLRPKHRREIRDLLRILYDDRVWQPHHTDRLLDIVRAARSDVAEEVEKTIASDYAAHKREVAATRRQRMTELREIESFRESLKDHHAKIEALLGVLIDLPVMKAMVDGPDGQKILDPTLIDQKDAKVALSAIEKVLKVTGALTPPKIDVELHGSSVFEMLDAIEVETVDE